MPIKQEIQKALVTLQKGETILYPTDTVWGIGCDATNESAVKKIYSIKERTASKSMIILVDSVEMLQNIISIIPSAIIEVIRKTTIPTSYIFAKPIGLAKNVIANDNTVAIRVVNDTFCKELIQKFGKPIVSTSANISGNKTPENFHEIDLEIKTRVDYIVKLKQESEMIKSSRIVRIKDDTIQVIRE